MAKKTLKLSPESQAAQHLANLLGRNVSGFESQRTSQSIREDKKAEQILEELISGKRKEQAFDLEKSLQDHPVWPKDVCLPLIVIAFILRKKDVERYKLLGEIDPDVINDKFAHFLFMKMKKLDQENKFSIEEIQKSIEIFGTEVYGHEFSPILRLGLYRRWFQVLATYPTFEQFENALSMIRENQSIHK